jgi:hypothetical protein
MKLILSNQATKQNVLSRMQTIQSQLESNPAAQSSLGMSSSDGFEKNQLVFGHRDKTSHTKRVKNGQHQDNTSHEDVPGGPGYDRCGPSPWPA